ncbi:MAG: hypothetical protein ACREIA_07045 [Opitutaceae bacterium]
MGAKVIASKARPENSGGSSRLGAIVIACAATIPFALLFLHACSIDR